MMLQMYESCVPEVGTGLISYIMERGRQGLTVSCSCLSLPRTFGQQIWYHTRQSTC